MKITGSLKQPLRGALERTLFPGPCFIQMHLRRQYPIEWALTHGQHPVSSESPGNRTAFFPPLTTPWGWAS